jgi:hypothetical protein
MIMVRYKNKGKRAVMNISTSIKITYLAREPHGFCTFNEYNRVVGKKFFILNIVTKRVI